jgi:hypothetical protein
MMERSHGTQQELKDGQLSDKPRKSGMPRRARGWRKEIRPMPGYGTVLPRLVPRAVGCKSTGLDIDADWLSVEADRFTRGEQAMWRAVILQALTDAASESQKYEARLEREKARRWLLAAGDDFVMVCDLAGFDPMRVKRHVRRALAGGCQWRMAPKKGSTAFQRR